MRHRLQSYVCLGAFVLAQLLSGEPLSPSEWRYYSPILSSQIRTLGLAEAGTILSGFCETPIRAVEGVGRTCTTRPLNSGLFGIVDRKFHPKGVIFGHFLGPLSDDAAVSGWSAETHPYRWGGTLLLSRRNGEWIPVWYRSALITDLCEKVMLADRREILLCEDEDSGMGHALHDLYTVDFEHPSDLAGSLLTRADSFEDPCARQKQVLKGFHWRADRQEFSVELATTDWERLSTEPYCASDPKGGRAASLRLRFAVTPQGLRKVERDSAPKP